MNRRDMVHRLYAAVGRLLVQAMCVVDDVYPASGSTSQEAAVGL